MPPSCPTLVPPSREKHAGERDRLAPQSKQPNKPNRIYLTFGSRSRSYNILNSFEFRNLGKFPCNIFQLEKKKLFSRDVVTCGQNLRGIIERSLAREGGEILLEQRVAKVTASSYAPWLHRDDGTNEGMTANVENTPPLLPWHSTHPRSYSLFAISSILSTP